MKSMKLMNLFTMHGRVSKLKSANFEQGNHNFIITVNAVICDAPARQFSKLIRSHNSRYACESSAVETEYF